MIFKSAIVVIAVMLNPELPADQDKIFINYTMTDRTVSMQQCKRQLPAYVDSVEQYNNVAVIKYQCVLKETIYNVK